jgi:hypothetical protein
LVEWELAEEIEVIGERGNLPNLSTIIPTWPNLRLNLRRHGGKPVTNRLNYGTGRSGDTRVEFVTKRQLMWLILPPKVGPVRENRVDRDHGVVDRPTYGYYPPAHIVKRALASCACRPYTRAPAVVLDTKSVTLYLVTK